MNHFNSEECNKIKDLFSYLPITRRDETPRLIKYDFCSISFSKENAWIFNKFNSFIEERLNTRVIKNLDTIHLFKYSVGDMFTKHRDVYYPGQAYNVGVNLNDDYEGGDFILYTPYQVIKKEAGKLYTFKNTVPHEVTQVTKGIRYSLIGFYFFEHLNIKQPAL